MTGLLRAATTLALLCAGGQALAAPRTPFQIRCEDTISKTVTVLTAQQATYSVDTHVSYRSLTAWKGAARANTYVLGLTKTESRVSMGLAGPMLQDPATGYECVAPQISVKLFYAPVVIYVGKEFPVGSCAYAEILKHEERHLKAYMDSLPRVEGIVRAALSKRFQDKPLYAPKGMAQAALASEMDSGWMPFIKNEMRKVEALQAAIDSPAEYARLGKACNGEIQNIMRGPAKPPAKPAVK